MPLFPFLQFLSIELWPANRDISLPETYDIGSKNAFLLTACNICWFCISCGSKQKVFRVDDNTAYAMLKQACLEKIVRDIAQYPTVDCGSIGIGSGQSEQYNRFLSLKKIATEEELIQLTDAANANVKAYAFLALLDRNYPKCYTVFEQHLKDTASFQYLSGCMGSTNYINLFYLRLLSNKFTHAQFASYKNKISKCFDQESWKQIDMIAKFY